MVHLTDGKGFRAGIAVVIGGLSAVDTPVRKSVVEERRRLRLHTFRGTTLTPRCTANYPQARSSLLIPATVG
jgi:hypothetical protein